MDFLIEFHLHHLATLNLNKYFLARKTKNILLRILITILVWSKQYFLIADQVRVKNSGFSFRNCGAPKHIRCKNIQESVVIFCKLVEIWPAYYNLFATTVNA
jgi:hypothetical protein